MIFDLLVSKHDLRARLGYPPTDPVLQLIVIEALLTASSVEAAKAVIDNHRMIRK